MLLPLIIYSTNVNLLTNNFLKAFRKEVQMLILNFSCIIIEIIGLTIIGYYLKNLEILLLWTVVIIVFRAILAECMVSKLIGISFLKDNMFEALLALLFIFSAMKLNLLHGFLLYGAGVMLYMIYSLKKANRFSHFGKPRTK